MTVEREKLHLESLDELLGSDDSKNGVQEVDIGNIKPFKDHPFKVLDNDNMEELVESIRENGVLTPVLVRPADNGEYEMISGHRRMHAASLAGLDKLPAVVTSFTDDEATIVMVDSNMQREEILPSERAFALKMKMEALGRQGKRTDLTCGLQVPKSADETCGPEVPKSTDDKKTRTKIGRRFDLGGRQVQRYIRLTELIPDILELVDKKKIQISLGVEISYLDKKIQKFLYKYIQDKGSIKKEQVKAARDIGDTGEMTYLEFVVRMDDALSVGNRDKDVMEIRMSRVNEYFPEDYTIKQKEDLIIQLLREWKDREKAGD